MSFVNDQRRLSKKTMSELIAIQTELTNDPKNKNSVSGGWIHNKKTRKKLDVIAWAIVYKLKEKQ